MSATQSGTATLTIAADHPSFAGHFPGHAIVPGVVLLDEALWAIGAMIGVDLSACAISSLKFVSPVLPGESLAVTYTFPTSATLLFEIHSDARKVATGALRLPAP
jgi:3-hydroxyacyl-[acyl-carrier-protein] dehydratase